MSAGQLVPFVGLAALYAALVWGMALALGRIVGFRPGAAENAFALLTLFFVFLTQHPFPPVQGFTCPQPGGAPQLTPFAFATGIWERFATGGLRALLADRLAAAATMNLVLPAAIGWALAALTGRAWVALAFAIALTSTIELTQRTGLWGLYPCPYRQFNIDDLMLNTFGLMAGFLISRRLRRRPEPASRPPAKKRNRRS